MPETNQPQSSFNNQGVIKINAEALPVEPGLNPQAPNLSAPSTEAGDKNKLAESDKSAETNKLPEPPVKQSDIYAMPKEFQHHNRVAGNNSSFWGILIVSFSFIFLVIIGIGFYLYIFNPGTLASLTGQFFGVQAVPPTPEVNIASSTPPSPASLAEGTEPATSTATSSVELPEITPKQTYLSYIKELAKINTFEDYYILVSKYGSRRRVTAVEGERLVAEATNETDKASVKAIKENMPKLTGSETMNETVNGDQASLTVAFANSKATGSVAFSLENGAWKIGDETWSFIKETPGAAAYTMGADRDGDGLTDAEEDLLGTNKDSTDSDNDGYSDLKEVSNLYDPASKGKLVDNPRIKSYLADDKSFYFLYPATWKRVNDKGSPIFMGPDNHFFQLVITDNDRHETLDDYVKRTLGITQIKDSLRRTSDTWTGIATEDGLTVYIMSLKQDKIYVFHYNPGDKNILEYPNIFAAMVKSFVIKK